MFLNPAYKYRICHLNLHRCAQHKPELPVYLNTNRPVLPYCLHNPDRFHSDILYSQHPLPFSGLDMYHHFRQVPVPIQSHCKLRHFRLHLLYNLVREDMQFHRWRIVRRFCRHFHLLCLRGNSNL